MGVTYKDADIIADHEWVLVGAGDWGLVIVGLEVMLGGVGEGVLA